MAARGLAVDAARLSQPDVEAEAEAVRIRHELRRGDRDFIGAGNEDRAQCRDSEDLGPRSVPCRVLSGGIRSEAYWLAFLFKSSCCQDAPVYDPAR
jgi:hypothetical protein